MNVLRFKKQTYLDKLISGQGQNIYKFSAVDEKGKKAWYFVLFSQIQLMMFQKKIKHADSEIDLSQFGKVIASCYGDNPDEETKLLLKEKYNFTI